MTSILRRAASSCVTTSQRLIKSPVNVYCLKLLRASLTKLLSGRVASHTRSSPAHFNAANTKFTRGSISEQRVGLIGNSHLDCPDVELYSYKHTYRGMPHGQTAVLAQTDADTNTLSAVNSSPLCLLRGSCHSSSRRQFNDSEFVCHEFMMKCGKNEDASR